MHAWPIRRGGRIVWTNGDAANTALQAMSLEGPVTAVINSSTAELGNQSFSLEPSISANYANLKSSYANITVAGACFCPSHKFGAAPLRPFCHFKTPKQR